MTIDQFHVKFPDAKFITLGNLFQHLNVIDRYEKYIIVNEGTVGHVEVNRNIDFKDCFIDVGDYFFLDDCNIKGYLSFHDCYFSKAFLIYSLKVEDNISFVSCQFKDVEIAGGELGNSIQMFFNSFDDLKISGGKFKSMDIMGGTTIPADGSKRVQEKLNSLQISNLLGELGNINVSSYTKIKEVDIQGNNRNNIFQISACGINVLKFQNFTNEGQCVLSEITGYQNSAPPSITISNSNLKSTQFYNFQFNSEQKAVLYISSSYIADCLFVEFDWNITINTNGELHKQKETFRQLRLSMNKHSDKIQENFFYGREMNIYRKMLKGRPGAWWDRWILRLSFWTSNYGQSLKRPFWSLLIGHLIFFWIGLLIGAFKPLQFSLPHPSYDGLIKGIETYLTYINPFRPTPKSVEGIRIIVIDVIMRIWSAYMIYNMIRASRRFIG